MQHRYSLLSLNNYQFLTDLCSTSSFWVQGRDVLCTWQVKIDECVADCKEMAKWLCPECWEKYGSAEMQPCSTKVGSVLQSIPSLHKNWIDSLQRSTSWGIAKGLIWTFTGRGSAFSQGKEQPLSNSTSFRKHPQERCHPRKRANYFRWLLLSTVSVIFCYIFTTIIMMASSVAKVIRTGGGLGGGWLF